MIKKDNIDVLINASNLHYGGGVQVASSFIIELFRLKKFDYAIFCSNTVYENVKNFIHPKLFADFQVIDVVGTKRLTKDQLDLFDQYKVCFTVFGPCYYQIQCSRHIVGFAQPWIAYPDNDAYKLLTVTQRLKFKLKYLIQKHVFKRYDLIVVEHEDVKKALLNQGFKHVDVVSNTISNIFSEPSKWESIITPIAKKKFTIGFIGRGYFHKNLSILKDVNKILSDDMELDFLFTLNDKEMSELGFNRIVNFYTTGTLSLEQVPSFYQQIDLLVFPSLLECFSASPLEAIQMNVPVACSNYSFLSNILGENALYFDAMNAKNISDTIMQAYNRDFNTDDAKEIVNALPTAHDRALKYIEKIESQLNYV